MNRIYRLIWSQVTNTWVAVSENAKGKGKSGSSRKCIVGALALVSPLALGAPAGGQISAGAGTITQAGANTTINQNSQNLAINWQSFSIASNEAVRFNQPNSSSIALNRVLGQNPSQILGSLSANGQVFVLNPNGILFGAGSQVNVGGLVASTLSLNDADFMSNKFSFSNAGHAGSVINQGTLSTNPQTSGGYITLLAPEVRNEGVITATLGTALLAAGNKVTLNLNNGSLLGYSIDQGALNALAENKQLIQADGGQVILSAKAANALSTAVVNNTGLIEARTIQNQGGVIRLLGDMQVGQVNVGGTLDASAPSAPSLVNGGLGGISSANGGFIETSAAHVNVANSAKVTTDAPSGLAGTWLIDPVDFTIAATGGDMTGAALSTSLGTTGVTILSTAGLVNATTGLGNINVNDVVTWTANTLTLNAQNNININANLNGSGTATLALLYGQGAAATGNLSTYSLNNGAQVNLPAGLNFSTTLGLGGAATTYTVITSLGAATDATTPTAPMTLQGIAATANLAGNYVLGANIDATATSTWNSNLAATPVYAGFTPVGTLTTPFTGTLNGLGHTVTNLTINLLTTNNVGLIGYAAATSIIRNVGLVGGSVTGSSYVGGLVGYNNGAISNSYATGSVTASAPLTTANTYAGGLVGYSLGTVNSSYATGNVSATASNSIVGGLIGWSYGTVSNSYATGTVNGNTSVGGLVGISGGAISNSYATGAVTSSANYAGGLVGTNRSTISNSYASGAVSGFVYDGGLVGDNFTGGSVINSYATGTVFGTDYVGGLVGFNDAGIGLATGTTVSISYSSGKVTGSTGSVYVGGIVGGNTGTVSSNYWDAGTSTQAVGIGGAGAAQTGTIGLTTANARFQTSYSPAGVYTPTGAGAALWDFTNVWYMVSGSTRPFLRSEWNTMITNTHQLQLMGTNLTASYILANNLNLAADLANPSGMWAIGSVAGTPTTVLVTVPGGFIPIGSSATSSFTGSFDGMGHTISNLTINLAGSTNVGLFGYTGTTATIQNIGLIDENVAGKKIVGGLIGFNSGKVINSYSTATTLSTTNNVLGTSSVGGLVGSNTGTISNSYVSSGTVMGLPTVAAGVVNAGAAILNVGGLVGLNSGTVTNSHYNIDAVQLNALNVYEVTLGGLYNVSVTNTALVGQYTDWLTNRLTTTPLNIANYSALLPAAVPAVANSYTLNSLLGLKALLGFADNPLYTFTLTGSIVLPAFPVAIPPAVAAAPANTGYIPYLAGTFDGGGFTISNLSVTLPNSYLGLFGVAATGSTIKNLGLIGGSVNGASYVGGLVGKNSGTISKCYTTGVVTGTGKKVGGLAGANYGTTGISSSYSTSNVGGAIPATNSMGGLVGYNTGAISNSYASTGTVIGTNSVGGLVGSNSATGTISSSFATGAVTGTKAVGGLVGTNTNIAGFTGVQISNSYATGNVSGGVGNSVGGLVGVNTGTISNSYSNTGTVTGAASVGGLVGFGTGGTVTNSFWNSATTGATFGIGGTSSNTGATPITSAQMMQSATFSSWTTNISNLAATGAIWRIYEGHTTPLLTSIMTALTLTGAVDTTVTYTGLSQSGVAYTGSTQLGPNAAIIGVSGSPVIGAVNAGFYNGYFSTQLGYNITGGNLTITPAALSVTASSVSNPYGSALPALAITYTGFVNGETATNLTALPTASTTATAASNVGTYPVTVAGAVDPNYTISYVNGTLTVTPVALTISASNQTRIYGAANPALTVSYIGFVNNDTSASLTTQPTVATTAIATSVVGGSYPITASGAVDPNYTITYAAGTLAVTPAPLTITANNASNTYGSVLPAMGVTYSGFVNSETATNFTTLPTASTTATAASIVGTYAITAAGAVDPNYTISYVNGTLTVNPAPLTISANNMWKTFGSANPTLGVSYSGFVNGESSANLSTLPTASTTATAASTAGSYAITAAGAVDTNYTMTYVNGMFNIVPLVLKGGAFTFPVVSTVPIPPSITSTQEVSSLVMTQQIEKSAESSFNAAATFNRPTPTAWGTIAVVDGGILMPTDSLTP